MYIPCICTAAVYVWHIPRIYNGQYNVEARIVLESIIRLQNYVPNIPGIYMTYTIDIHGIYVTYTCFSDPLVLQGFKEAINTG